MTDGKIEAFQKIHLFRLKGKGKVILKAFL